MDLSSFFSLSYGMYVVTSKHDGQSSGYVANTVFQVSADPPQIAISCHKDNLSFETIRRSKAFNISVLQQEASAEMIQKFGYQSGRDVDKFSRFLFGEGKNGIPILQEDTVASFETEVVQAWDVGTHVVFVAKVVEAEWVNKEMSPLTYAHYHESKRAFSPKNSPTYIAAKDLPQSITHGTEYNGTGSWKLYVCPACGYVYDPEIGDEDSGIPPGTSFDDIPEDWECPVCGVMKSGFIPLD